MSFEYKGLHLMADVVVLEGSVLSKPASGIDLIEKIVSSIDMTLILPPVTVKFPHAVGEMDKVLKDLTKEGLSESLAAKNLSRLLLERKSESFGYSTFAMIAESHLSIHTFPELNYFSFDCYSCKDFNSNKVLDLIHDQFEIKKIIVNRVERRIPSVD